MFKKLKHLYQEIYSPTKLAYSNLQTRSDEIIVAGWEASGSTFIYQVSTMLGLKTTKCHGLIPTQERVFTVFPFRDPRDIITSNAKRLHSDIWNLDPEQALLLEADRFVEDKFPDAIRLAKKTSNVMLIRYEAFFLGGETQLIQLIADQFWIPISTTRIKQILNATSMETNLARALVFSSFDSYDKSTHIHGNHITNQGKSGGWRKSFTARVEKHVESIIGPLLDELGYER